jgi:hypothetical protein
MILSTLFGESCDRLGDGRKQREKRSQHQAQLKSPHLAIVRLLSLGCDCINDETGVTQAFGYGDPDEQVGIGLFGRPSQFDKFVDNFG